MILVCNLANVLPAFVKTAKQKLDKHKKDTHDYNNGSKFFQEIYKNR